MYHQPEIDFTAAETLLYSRKSRTDDPTLSVEDVLAKHEKILDDWALEYLGAVVPEKNKFREVQSGETIDDRPEIQKVLQLIESPQYRALLIVEVQRLSRGDLEDAGRLIKLLRYTNTLVITPHKIYDLRDEYDRDTFERELKRGNEYLEYQKKIMNRGRLLSVQQGNYIGSVAPYGYEKITIGHGRNKCHTLKIKPEEAEVVRMVFDMYVNEDMGRTSIANRLNDLGIKPAKAKRWQQSIIKDMLENVHYIGKVKWFWRKTIKIVEDGEIIKTRPKSSIDEYLIYEGKQDAIISDELFKAALDKKGRNPKTKPKNKIRNPFAGLVFCQCGRAMTYRTYIRDGVERSAPRLLCDDQAHCGTSSCLYSEMLDHVIAVLEECIEDFEIRIQNNDGDSIKLHASLIKRLEAKQAELAQKELNQWEKYTSEDMPKHIFDMLNEKVRRDQAEVREALCKARESLPEPVDYEEKLYRFRDALDALRDPDVTPAAKNRLLKACIERITYRREKAVRMTQEMAGGKGVLSSGSQWTSPPIELDVKLRL